MKLNLGCGEDKKEGFTNVDWNKDVNPDIVMDISKKENYNRFKDSSVEMIVCSHILEHLSNPFEIIKECHRILKEGGLLYIAVPHFSRGFTHSEHKCGFDVALPLYFNPSFTKSGYMGYTFKLQKMRLSWFGQPYLKKKVLSKSHFYCALILGKLIDFFANLNLYLCSKIWCFWVGGFDQIEYWLRKDEKKE